jgi:predicted neutral ceramidase superfamily lipid hydrolase
MSNELGKKEKKFLVNFMLHIAMFLAVLALSVLLNETNDLSIYSTGFLAMTPVIPVIFLLQLVVKHYRSLDEYIQRVMGESLLWAVGIVGCAAMAYGLLSEMVEVPSISLAFMLPAIAVIFGLAQSIKLASDTHEE